MGGTLVGITAGLTGPAAIAIVGGPVIAGAVAVAAVRRTLRQSLDILRFVAGRSETKARSLRTPENLQHIHAQPAGCNTDKITWRQGFMADARPEFSELDLAGSPQFLGRSSQCYRRDAHLVQSFSRPSSQRRRS